MKGPSITVTPAVGIALPDAGTVFATRTVVFVTDGWTNPTASVLAAVDAAKSAVLEAEEAVRQRAEVVGDPQLQFADVIARRCLERGAHLSFAGPVTWLRWGQLPGMPPPDTIAHDTGPAEELVDDVGDRHHGEQHGRQVVVGERGALDADPRDELEGEGGDDEHERHRPTLPGEDRAGHERRDHTDGDRGHVSRRCDLERLGERHHR